MNATASAMGETSNGLDVAALTGLVELLRDSPAKARVTFETGSRWQGGARVLTDVGGFRIDGEPVHGEDRRFVLLSDEPRELGASDAAPGPGEQLMHALASCIAATVNANAAFMGVALDQIEVTVSGELDLRGILALDDTVRPGLSGLTATVAIAGNADPATLRELVERGVRYSPVRDSVERGVPIRVGIQGL